MKKFLVCALCIFIMLVFPGILHSAPPPPSPTNVNIVSPVPLPVTVPDPVTIGNSPDNPIPVNITNPDGREYATFIVLQTRDSLSPRTDTDCPITPTDDNGTDPPTPILDAYSVMMKIDQNGTRTDGFRIPSGKRLVITDIESIRYISSPMTVALRIVPLSSTSIQGIPVVFAWVANASGEMISVHLSTGIYVSDLANLCYGGNNYSSSSIVNPNIALRLRGYIE